MATILTVIRMQLRSNAIAPRATWWLACGVLFVAVAVIAQTPTLNADDERTLRAIAASAPKDTVRGEKALPAELPELLRQRQADALREVVRQNSVRGDAVPGVISEASLTPEPLPWKTVVFISTSMPEGTLRALFSQAKGRADVLFVVRGWFPPDIAGMINRLAALMPDRANLANVVVHPELFRVYNVQTVPAFIHEVGPDKWKQAFGEISLAGAEEQLLAARNSLKPIPSMGRTWVIAEPDALQEIETRVASHDWDKEMQVARDRASGDKPASVASSPELPVASVRRVRTTDPTVVLEEDIRLPDGRIVATAGTRINPLDHVAFPHTVVVIDPTDAPQIVQAKRWLQGVKQGAVLVTRMPLGGSQSVSKSLGVNVYPLNAELVDRFQFEAVPSRAVAVGRLIEITEEPPRGPKQTP